MSDPLLPIREAIKTGDKAHARELLRPLLKAEPTAELWYLAAYACESRDHARQCLNRAIFYDRDHHPTRRALAQLESGAGTLPPLDAPAAVPVAIPEPLIEPPLNRPARARTRPKRTGPPWGLIGCGGSLLLSLSLSYVVLTYLDSPIAAQVRAVLRGEVGAPTQGEGTPVFGAAPGMNAPPGAFVVQPSKSAEIKRQQPASDVMDAGKAHEYTFEAYQGEELAIGIQFLSPTARQVGANVAVIDPDGLNAESRCQRDFILTDGSSVAFICQVHKSGTWKLHIFGRDGESTGVYVVTYERM